MNKKNVYIAASIRIRERMSSKVKSKLDKKVIDDGMYFVKLTQTIPNWKTYLTKKQLEVVDHYLKSMSTSEVDIKLNLVEGTTYHRLFGKGSPKDKGAFGTLKKVYKMLEESNNKKIAL